MDKVMLAKDGAIPKLPKVTIIKNVNGGSNPKTPPKPTGTGKPK